MNNRTTRGWRYAVYLLYGLLCTAFLYLTPRSEFEQLIVLYGGMFLVYVLLTRTSESKDHIQDAIVAGILLRIIATFAAPNLTDDHYRFIWDGQLVAHGYNPYTMTPEQVRAAGFLGMEGINTELFSKLNSASYISVYPPIAQALFGLAAKVSFDSWNIQVLVIKLMLLAFECSTIVLLPEILRKIKLPEGHALWYILNPLIIIELSGNMHVEGIMVYTLLLSLYWYYSGRHTASAIAFGFAVSAKLWPLMLLPVFFRPLGFKNTMRYSVIAGSVALVLLSPMLLQFTQISGSLNLYFQQFEFNGSIFYIGKYLFNKEADYEAFSAMRATLPFLACAAILLLSVFYKKHALTTGMLMAFSVYLLFATTVHPWYLAPVILLSVLSGYRFGILWSLLIYLTYYTYITPAYIENTFFIWIEYTAVIVFAIWEFSKRPFLDTEQWQSYLQCTRTLLK